MRTELLNQLNQETHLADEMIRLLDDEREALATADAPLLQQCALRKQTLIAELEAQARKWLERVAKLGYRRESGTLRDFLLRCDPTQTLARRSDTLHEKLALCRDKNQINGRAINLGQRHTEMALSVLKGQLPGGNCAYNRAGKATTQPYGCTLTQA